MRSLITFVIITSAGLISCTGCGNGPTFEGYTQWNIHYNAAKNSGSVVNWTEFPAHDIIPINTKASARSRGNWIYVTPEGQQEVKIAANSAYLNMDQTEYIETLLAPEPLDISAMSDIDRKGISNGKVHLGMSKEGVMAALGYPAAHQTPSLEYDTWIYWKGRFGRRKVRFEPKDQVVEFTPYKYK